MPEPVNLRDHLELLLAQEHAARVAAIVGLKELVEELRKADQLALAAALTAAEKAVSKAEVATENRLMLLNELRSGVATKEQYEALVSRLDDLRSQVVAFISSQSGRAGGLKDYIAWIVASVAIAGFIIDRLVR